MEWHAQARREVAHEGGVGVGRGSAQPVVNVRDARAKAERAQRVQQGDGVGSAGHGCEDPLRPADLGPAQEGADVAVDAVHDEIRALQGYSPHARRAFS
jgi:hypothetical protein